MEDDLVMKNASTTNLIYELRLRGYICYKRGSIWKRCKCNCGYKADGLVIEGGKYTLRCPKCGRSYTGKSMESAEREWKWGMIKERLG